MTLCQLRCILPVTSHTLCQSKRCFNSFFGREDDRDTNKSASHSQRSSADFLFENVTSRKKEAPKAAAGAAAAANTPFLKGVHDLHSKQVSQRSSRTALPLDSVMSEERREMLHFRDVGMSLDRPEFPRDILPFRVKNPLAHYRDSLLQREARYFEEHAKRELLQSPKLMHGLPFLVRASTAVNFPSLEGVVSASAFVREDGKRVVSLFRFFRGFESQRISSSDFTKPTLLTIAQLGYRGNVDAWQRAACASERGRGNLQGDVTSDRGKAAKPPSNVDFVDLRSIDVTTTRFLKPVLMRKWARQCVAESRFNTSIVYRAFSQLYTPLMLRNFYSTYCFLLDHHGRIRWMSAGGPNDEEARQLAPLLAELVREYTASRPQGVRQATTASPLFHKPKT